MNIINYCTLQDNSNYVGRSSGLVCFLCCCSPCRCPLHPPDEVYIHGASWFKRTSRWLTRTLCRYCLCLCHNKYPDPSVLRVQGHFPPFLTGSSQDNCMICWECNILIIRWHWSEQPQALLESLLETEWPLTFVSSKPHRGRKPKVGCFLGSLSCSASEAFTVKTPSICSG